MISLKDLMKPDILKRHRQYISNSDIYENLTKLKDELKTYVTQKQIKKFDEKIEKETLVSEFENFIDLLIGEVEDLKEGNDLTTNLFLAPPNELNNKYKLFLNKFPLVTKFIEWESKNIEKKEKKKKLSISDKLLNVFGYDKFKNITLNKTGYSKLINSLKGPHSEYMEEIRRNYNMTISEEDRSEIINDIERKLKKFSLNIEIDELHKSLIFTIKHSKDDENNRNNFINVVTKIFKDSEKNLLKKYEKIGITIDRYKRVYQDTVHWSPYHYVMMLELKTCPYCNRSYITPLYSEDGMLRADLDHFLPKYKYPYFSMSIYNLVPSCKFCNSSLKSTRDFTYEDNLNPFEEGFNNLLKFRFKDLNNYFLPKSIRIYLQEYEDVEVQDTTMIKKARGNAKVFKIDDLYQYHIPEVIDLIRKRYVYSRTLIAEIRSTLENCISEKPTNQDVIEFLVGNIISEDLHYERPLSKMYKDITDQLQFEKIFSSSKGILKDDELTGLKKFINS